MKKTFKSLIFFLFFSLMFSACSKYEDGPAICLLTKTARLTGEWKLKSQLIDGKWIDMSSTTLKLIINKNGKGAISSSPDGSNFTDLEWEWTESKEGVKLKLSNGIQYEFEIKRLTNSSLNLGFGSDYVMEYTK